MAVFRRALFSGPIAEGVVRHMTPRMVLVQGHDAERFGLRWHETSVVRVLSPFTRCVPPLFHSEGSSSRSHESS